MQADPSNQIKPQPTKKCDRTILNRATNTVINRTKWIDLTVITLKQLAVFPVTHF
jgi:hypothetical protein